MSEYQGGDIDDLIARLDQLEIEKHDLAAALRAEQAKNVILEATIDRFASAFIERDAAQQRADRYQDLAEAYRLAAREQLARAEKYERALVAIAASTGDYAIKGTAKAALAEPERQQPECPNGCGCRVGTDDADRNECACDGPCCTTYPAERQQPEYTPCGQFQTAGLVCECSICQVSRLERQQPGDWTSSRKEARA